MMEEVGGFRIGWELHYRGKVHGRSLATQTPCERQVLTSKKFVLVDFARCLRSYW